MWTMVRGIRGAITVEQNDQQEIYAATQELLKEIVEQNQLELEEVCSIFFTVTQDLDATFPARAARGLGWDFVPLLCALEVDVVGSLRKCIRVLVHVNTEKSQKEIKHIYLGGAQALRPDLLG